MRAVQSLPAWVWHQADRQHPDLPERVDKRATDEQIIAMIGKLQAATAPATAEEFAVAMVELTDFMRAFRLSSEDTEIAVRCYHDVMRETPIDLVVETVRALIANWKWGNRPPLPADLKAYRPEAYWDRLEALRLFRQEARERGLVP